MRKAYPTVRAAVRGGAAGCRSSPSPPRGAQGSERGGATEHALKRDAPMVPWDSFFSNVLCPLSARTSQPFSMESQPQAPGGRPQRGAGALAMHVHLALDYESITSSRSQASLCVSSLGQVPVWPPRGVSPHLLAEQGSVTVQQRRGESSGQS